MPYDITDAKEQIEELTAVINYMYGIMKDNNLIKVEEPEGEKLKKLN